MSGLQRHPYCPPAARLRSIQLRSYACGVSFPDYGVIRRGVAVTYSQQKRPRPVPSGRVTKKVPRGGSKAVMVSLAYGRPAWGRGDLGSRASAARDRCAALRQRHDTAEPDRGRCPRWGGNVKLSKKL